MEQDQKKELAKTLAQAALRGWFHDPTGFRDMSERGPNGAAVKAVYRQLLSQEVVEDKKG